MKRLLPLELRLGLRRLFYHGASFHCPLCKASLRTMLDAGLPFPVLHDLDVIGGEPLEGDLCPVCFCHSRMRLLMTYLRREVPPGGRVLHVAPERQVRAYLEPISHYVAADLDPSGYEETVEGCDITSMPWPDASFDLILCCHVLEHVADDAAAIRELRRVLAPGGVAVLQVPLSSILERTISAPCDDPREREQRYGQHDHLRLYGQDYPERLREGGFAVEIFVPETVWGSDAVTALRLNPREKLYLGR